MKFSRPALILMILSTACGKNNLVFDYPHLIQGNWQVTSQFFLISSYPRGIPLEDDAFWNPGSDSLSIDFKDETFVFSHILRTYGNNPVLLNGDSLPVLTSYQFLQDVGRCQSLNDSQLLIQPDTSSFLKFCGNINNNLLVQPNDTVYYKLFGNDSMTISMQSISHDPSNPSNLLITNTITGFRKH